MQAADETALWIVSLSKGVQGEPGGVVHGAAASFFARTASDVFDDGVED